jgi:hypothetical protein
MSKTSKQTTQPNIPPEAANAIYGAINRGNELFDKYVNAPPINFQNVTPQNVNLSGVGDLAYAPASIVGDLAYAPASLVGAISPISAQTVSARKGSEFIQDYMNPYLKDVVDTSLADFDTGAERAGAARALGRAASGAWGDLGNIDDAIFAADNIRNRAALGANLRAQGFNAAAGFGSQDANRFLSADTTNANNALQANMFNANIAQQANLANQAAINNANMFNAGVTNDARYFNANAANQGQIINENAANQANMFNATGQYNAAVNNRNFPLDAFNTFITSPLSGLSGTFGQTTRTNDGGAGVLNLIGQIGGAALMNPNLFKSDRRTKTDIKRVGTLDNGLPVYTFRYKSGGPHQLGLMAQDVETINPDAVVEIGGVKYVNYQMAAE